MDRRHSNGGLFFDRGVFRRLTKDMDHEYDIDVVANGFSLTDDHTFFGGNVGFRNYMVSISKSRFASQNYFRAETDLGSRSHVGFVDASFREDLRVSGAHFKFGYGYRLDETTTVGAFQTVASYKPDLDFGVFAKYKLRGLGIISGRITLLDAANNFIFDKIGVDPVLEDTIRIYQTKPRLIDLSFESSPANPVRLQLLAGIQTQSDATIHLQSTDSVRFQIRDKSMFVGFLAESSYRFLTGTVYLTGRRSNYSRESLGTSLLKANYSTAQNNINATVTVAAMADEYFGRISLSREYYGDEQNGSVFEGSTISAPMDYRERNWFVNALVERAPDRGLRAGVRYFSSVRNITDAETMRRYLRFLQSRSNSRISLHMGYSFSSSMYFVTGAAYDVDGDSFYTDGRGLTRFDGGFFRFTISW